jgi:hypothetical protein
MGILVRLIGIGLMVEGLTRNEGAVSQLFLFLGALSLLYPTYKRFAVRQRRVAS